ncbi:MAG: SUMF1/EgtB/PvdO family nonheme iron enzyme, partial [Anaerolineae bacterium]|nr:SUMF1/EgtB/PvdO family nonheme iron enzyme [Anaerolineae bacterium]
MEKRFKFFLVLVSLVSLLIPQSSKSSLTPAPTYAISGKVTDSDGNPIAGALITATTTLTDWTHQIYLPAILQPFSGTTTPARTLPPNHFSTDLILQSPDTAHRFIKFPVQNQTVATFTGSTDVNGYYVLTGLSSGSYTLSASKKGYVLYPDNFSITLPPSASGINFSEPVIDPDEMVTIPSGIFQMGCDPAHNDNASCAAYELPLHAVALDTFQITKYEVTNSQYALCVASGACPPPKHNSSETRTSYYGNPDFANYPVIWVKWQNAADYCAWAGMRLPTEAEWEKAARGTASIQTFPWGDETPDCT